MNNNYYRKRKRAVDIPLSVILVSLLIAVILIAGAAVIFGKKEKSPEDGKETQSTVTDAIWEEIQGVYVASVYNLNFPSAPDLTEKELKSEMDSIIETTEKAGLNTVVFQVRPSCDALYKSELYPVSLNLSSDRKLTLDCLEYMTENAHKKGLKVYAWINPLRVSVTSDLEGNLTAEKMADYTVVYNNQTYFDPAYTEVRKLVADGVSEICSAYDVDGILFDDYFYPYKTTKKNENGVEMPVIYDDADSYNMLGGNYENIDDFRRANVNKLIKEVYNAVKSADEKCLFGVAPFGIWKNGQGDESGSLTSGLESYSNTYSDTVAWIEGGYVDFIAPQIYWECSNTTASFKVLTKWWSNRCADKGVKLLVSHAAYKYEDTFKSGEITSQLTYADNYENYGGSLFYSYSAISGNTAGITDEITNYYNNRSAEATETSAEGK